MIFESVARPGRGGRSGLYHQLEFCALEKKKSLSIFSYALGHMIHGTCILRSTMYCVSNRHNHFHSRFCFASSVSLDLSALILARSDVLFLLS